LVVSEEFRTTEYAGQSQAGLEGTGLSLKDRLILELDMTDMLRPSELFALR